MKIIYFLLFFLLACPLLKGQDGDNHQFADGIYYTLEDFISKKPDTTIGLKKLNLYVPTSIAFADTIVDHVYFLNKENDIIKKVFAIVHKGELYFQEKGMKKYMVEGYTHSAIGATPVMHRIKGRGRYYYGESTYTLASEDAGLVAMGAMFGLVGAMAVALTSETTGPREMIAPFVFDSKHQVFYVFVMRGRLKEFMKFYYPDYPIELDEARLDAASVSELFVDLNKRNQGN